VRRFHNAIVIGALCLWSIPAISQTQPPIQKPNPATVVDTQPSIGPMRVRLLPAFSFLYAMRNTTLNTIGPTADAEIAKLLAAMKANGIQPVGPAVLIYHSMTGDRNQKFDLDIGMQVADNAVAPQGYQLSHKAAAHCATVLFGGSVADVGQAYRDLFTNLSTRDLIPTGETREYYLTWDGGGSPNNVIWIAACAE
jgi:effector-binding domain-containing protein